MNRRQEHPKQRKALSQIFLREDWPCRKLVEQLKARRVTAVVEIGPGNGILTRVLLKEGIAVTAVEKDERFAERLVDVGREAGVTAPLEVVHEDALRFDLAAWLRDTPGVKAVCGNIPYHISSPLLMWVLPHLKELRCSLLMVQLEFGQRVAAAPSTKAYGSLSVFVQLRAKANLEFKVERTCFYPIPKVDSVVVSLLPLAQSESEDTLRKVEQLTLRAFTQRRKMLNNSLSPFLKGIDTAALGIDLSRRCDSLSPKEFVDLAKVLDL